MPNVSEKRPRLLSAVALPATGLLAASLSYATGGPAHTPVEPVYAAAARVHTTANPHQRGPAPTEASLTATNGPFTVATRTVSKRRGIAFGGGTIYHPKNNGRTYGAIAIVPGMSGGWATISWLGPRLASRGFVVIGIESHTMFDPPGIRGRALLSALDYLVERSPVRGLVDPSRLAVAGYSLGGGGVLEAADRRTSLKAAIGLTPYNGNRSWPGIRTPIMIVGGQTDVVSPPESSTLPLYGGLTKAKEKAYLEFKGAAHAMPRSPNGDLAKYMIVWFKRFVDNDTRYTRFLCPAPSKNTILSDVRITCPM